MPIDTDPRPPDAPADETVPAGATGEPAEPGADPVGSAEDPEAGHPLLLAALVTLVSAPVLIVGIMAARQPWYPAGDWADVALGAIEVGTDHTPLVGVYSRYGWNHPGPMMFWLYAVGYRLFGSAFSGMIMTAAVLNAASAGGAVVLAWRRGRLVLAGTVAVSLALVVNTLGPSLLRDPWNPWITVLPFGLLVLATWAAVEGDTVALVVVAVAGSFLSQTHIGFVPSVGLLTVVAAAGFWVRRREWKPLAGAGAVLVVSWLPVLVHVLSGGDNVSRIVEHFSGDSESVGLSYAFGVTALELGGWGPWLGAPEPGMPDGGGVEPGVTSLLVIPLVAFAAALGLAWWNRRHDPRPLRLQVVVGLSVLVALLAVSRISGIVFSYLIRWWWPLVALWWASIGWSLWCALGRRLPMRAQRFALGALTTVALLLSGQLAIAVVTHDHGMLESSDGNAAQAPLAYFTEQVLPEVPSDRAALYRMIGPNVGWVGDGLALQLLRSGREIHFEDEGSNRFKYGEDRMRTPEAGDAGLVLMSGIGIEELARRGDGRELGRWDPLSPEERNEAWALTRELRARYSDLGREDLVTAIDLGTSLWEGRDLPGIDMDDFVRYHELRSRGEPLALFLYERADEAPDHT